MSEGDRVGTLDEFVELVRATAEVDPDATVEDENGVTITARAFIRAWDEAAKRAREASN